jgi:hypothetical protein
LLSLGGGLDFSALELELGGCLSACGSLMCQ